MTLNSLEDNLVSNVYPLGMQNSGLVLKDDEENSVITELDELSSASEHTVTPAAINIENSKDVIIGPVTQFHGPVTIYQNVNGSTSIENGLRNDNNICQNGKLVKSDSTTSDAPHTADRSSKPSASYSKHLKYIGIPVVFIIIIVIISSAIILSNKSEKTPYVDPDYTDPVDDNATLRPIVPGSLIDRTKWGGRPPLNFTKPLHHPTPFVLISHTATPPCSDFAQCSKKVLSIQQYHVGTLKYPDICYNFLIGGDAIVYVGRGWDIKNCHMFDSIGISFIGNYIYEYLSKDMIKSAQDLLAKGVETGKLAKDYKLIGHNQTYATQSPGPHIYDVIKTWPHFDPGSF